MSGTLDFKENNVTINHLKLGGTPSSTPLNLNSIQILGIKANDNTVQKFNGLSLTGDDGPEGPHVREATCTVVIDPGVNHPPVALPGGPYAACDMHASVR